MLNKIQKQEQIDKLSQILKDSKIGLISDYRGLSVKEIEKLRCQLREIGASLRVVKTSLFNFALQKNNLTIDESFLTRPLIFIAGEEEVITAKTLNNFLKENEKLELLGGWLEGGFIEKDEILKLAVLPSREQLHGQLVGMLSGLLSRLVYTLTYNQRSLLIILKSK
ncbi:MAG: 50S ribosomal protein L10 RplJ [Candidatus Berkelbacteria bacterium Licking1014_2]|uniref:Large ribosomal subunit protein uL10 n=1 Tax=Candidatus Berkelbacteria bacterium Licking1014_2 TaxID=2017146 RepID=A0A554LW86_9BACT|nr:MAG: 50S ribosomal protein L10 RplJ [Candidatus Berkelbacteria bacterium Licking1014_2]